MSLSKKQLKEIKNKLVAKDQDAISRIRNAKTKVTKNSVTKSEGFERKKSVVRWNYKINDLVRLTYGDNIIGLIVSDYEYFSKRVEKNCFFVLVENSVKQVDGRFLRQI